MPQLISTPEEWFRNQMRDLYLIRPAQERKYSKKKYMGEQKKLHTWLAAHLPNIPTSIIGSSEYSGWITGGPSYLAADFDSAGLATFTAAWGEGTFWRIETWFFAEWRKRVESVNLLSSPSCEVKRVRWWDTPLGILLLNATTEGRYLDGGDESGEITLSLGDGWWRLQQLFPEFSEYKAYKFPSGVFYRREQCAEKSYLILDWVHDDEWKSETYAKDVQKIQNLKIAIGIPEDMPLEIYDNDF